MFRYLKLLRLRRIYFSAFYLICVLLLWSTHNSCMAKSSLTTLTQTLENIREIAEIADKTTKIQYTSQANIRTTTNKLNAAIILAISNYPNDAKAVLYTALDAAPSHRHLIRELVREVFPGLRVLAHTTKNNAPHSNVQISYKKEYTFAKPMAENTARKLAKADDQINPLPLNNQAQWKKLFLRTSFEEIDLPAAGEQMGLFSVGVYESFFPWMYGGLTAFGAATGKRGGFFTGGFSTGFSTKLISNVGADGGIFVGAGGGGAAPQGGGLMLRPHLGLTYTLNNIVIGAGYSQINFPNGEIDSDAIYIELSAPLESANRDWNSNVVSAQNYLGEHLNSVSKHRSHIAIRARTYLPTDESKKTSGQKLNDNIGLIGIDYALFLNKHWFLNLESAGAFSGNVGGYAELLGGFGYRLPIAIEERLAISPSLTVGGAGGGGVDTGGGLVGRTNLALEYKFLNTLGLLIEGGYINALDGNFAAPYAGMNLAYTINTFASGTAGSPFSDNEQIDTSKWRIRPAHQWYFSAQRNNSTKKDMELLGTKFDWIPGNWWYLTGQAISAYDGGAGGYAEGLWGFGIFTKSWNKLYITSEALIGVGGGGGVDSGSGLIAKATGGLGYDISSELSLELNGGKIISREGTLDSNFIETNLVYRIGVPFSRN